MPCFQLVLSLSVLAFSYFLPAILWPQVIFLTSAFKIQVCPLDGPFSKSIKFPSSFGHLDVSLYEIHPAPFP